jgi:hypothetical protein
MLEKQYYNEVECECGFLLLGEHYETCPVCGKEFYKGRSCFYKNEDESCSLDGEECKWKTRKECGKEV